MIDFFSQLTGPEQTYWLVAMAGSFVLLIVLIMTFVGGDVDSGIDADSMDDGGAGFQFFTFKNFVSFFTMFGWVGVICIGSGYSQGLTLLLATIAGLIMMLATSSLFYFMSKLSESGTLVIANAVGEIGEVYLPIGASRSNIGKIQIKVQGSLRELDALTDEAQDLKTGVVVQVVSVISSELLLVKSLSK